MNVRARTRGIMGVILIGIVVWLAGIAHAGPEQMPTVRYANIKVLDPVFVGVEKGFFEDAGVKVELVGNFQSGPAGVIAGAAGQLDAGLCATTGLIGARANGIEVRGIADQQTEFIGAPLQKFYVMNDSPIRNVRDLRGKKVAVNSTAASFYYSALAALRKAGLDAGDVEWVVLAFPQMEAALRTGRVDAVGMIDPFNKRMFEGGGVRVLFRAVDAIGERQFSVLWFTINYMERNEPAIRAFVKGFQRSVRYMREHPVKTRDVWWKYLGVDPKYISKHRYTLDAGIVPQDVGYWLDFMRKEGALKDDGKLKPASIVTVRYTGTRAMKAAGRR